MVAKRAANPLLHIDFMWNLTESAKRLREYSRYGHDLFRKVIALPPILHTVWMNDSGVFLFLTTMQIHNETVQNGSDSYSFLERLLDISNENSEFTPDDVIAETATIQPDWVFSCR